MSFTTLDPPLSGHEVSDSPWDDLRPNQAKALTALAEGHTVVEAAQLADVNRSTLNKWIAEDDAFRDAFRAIKADALDSVSRRLTRLGIKATQTLEDVLDNSANDAIRLRASTDTLNLILKSIEVYEIANRLEALEAQLSAALADGG